MKGKLFQLQTALASCFGQTTLAMLNTWPSYTLSILSSNETSPLSEPITTAEESLLGSLPALGALVGTPIAGTLIDNLGRRNGGILLSLPMVICWVIVSVTTSKTLVLAARFLGGISGGANLVYAPIFISEVAEDSIRGTLASGTFLLYCLGTFFSYIFGWTLSYHTIVWVNLVFSIIMVLSIMSLKESPVFLLKQKKDKEALAAIAHYRGVSPSSMLVLDELAKLKQQLMTPVELVSVTADAKNADLKAEEAEKEKLNTENVVQEEQKKKSSIKLLLMSPTSRRAFLIVTTVMSLQVLMGISPVLVFAKKVFEQTDPTHPDLYSVVLALVLTGGCLVPTVIADMVGRRVLIITSSALTCACLGSIGFLLQTGVAPPWVTVVAIMLFCFIFMSGAGSVPYVLLAEVFTSEVQNLASTIIVQWGWFLIFVMISVFPFLNNLIGIHGSFYCFALIAITNSIVSYFIVPETKGLSNARIQELLMPRKKNKNITF